MLVIALFPLTVAVKVRMAAVILVCSQCKGYCHLVDMEHIEHGIWNIV